MTNRSEQTIGVGKISGVFGVKGWVKVFSDTDPVDNILNYSPWILVKNGQARTVKVLGGHLHNKGIVAQLDGIVDRDQALHWMGSEVRIAKSLLPKAQEGEFYWADLIGLQVETVKGESLGIVDGLLATGANDVLVVKGPRERAIPFLQGRTVVKIDLDGGVIVVDWDLDF